MRELDGELRDQAYAVAGAARHAVVVAARALEETGARHVDVRPRPLARELLEELRREHGRALAQRRAVLHVGERGVDVAPVARVQRERPDEVAAALAGGDDPVAPVVVVREEAGVEVAERELHRAGQRREVEDVRRALAPRVPERVGEHEAALGVGVDDLDRLPVRGAQDVAGAERVAAGQVLGGGEHGDRAHGQLQRGDGADAVQRARAARHVALHVLHLRGGLQRDPAGVEGDRLADEPERDVGARRPSAGRSAARSGAARCGCRGRPRRARPCRACPSRAARGSPPSGARARPRAPARARRARAGRARSAACSRGRVRGSCARRASAARSAASRSSGVSAWPITIRSIGARALVGVLRLPLPGRVAAEDRAFDERARLLRRARAGGSRRAASRGCRRRGRATARRRLPRCGTRRVDLVALAEPGRDDARCVELAVRVQEQRLAAVAAELAALGEPAQEAAELLVDDPRALAGERARDRDRERVDARLAREGDLDVARPRPRQCYLDSSGIRPPRS